MHLLLLPGMDGTGELFEPLLRALPPSLRAIVVAFPADKPWGYEELLPLVEAAVPDGVEFVILAESFSGPLAFLLAARDPPGLRGVILSASFVRSPVPAFMRYLRFLVRPLWFRSIPNVLPIWALLGSYTTAPLRTMLQETLAKIRPTVMAARARAVRRRVLPGARGRDRLR